MVVPRVADLGALDPPATLVDGHHEAAPPFGVDRRDPPRRSDAHHALRVVSVEPELQLTHELPCALPRDRAEGLGHGGCEACRVVQHDPRSITDAHDETEDDQQGSWRRPTPFIYPRNRAVILAAFSPASARRCGTDAE
jgi:hypothetical protein